MQRRKLDHHSADEVIAEIRQLQSGGYQRAGNWNLTQICEHLDGTMLAGMDGFGTRAPRLLRATVLKWFFYRALRQRKIPSNVPTLKKLKPKHDNTAEDDAVIETCIATLERARDYPGPIKNYPLLDELSVDHWRDFMWIHANHHLSFLIPQDTGSSGG